LLRKKSNENLLLANLQGSAGVVSGGAREAELKGRLRPSFTDKSMRQRFAKHAQDILEEHIHLLSTSDGPYFGRDVLVTPQRLIVSVEDSNKKFKLAYLCLHNCNINLIFVNSKKSNIVIAKKQQFKLKDHDEDYNFSIEFADVI
jgi:Na+/serine symporter